MCGKPLEGDTQLRGDEIVSQGDRIAFQGEEDRRRGKSEY